MLKMAFSGLDDEIASTENPLAMAVVKFKVRQMVDKDLVGIGV